MHFFVYIIYSSILDRYYVGYTKNPQGRLVKHNLGVTNFTRRGRPWELVYVEEFSSRTEAIKRESQIKRMKSRKYIESL
ncbi:MAG: GIY-YIG nuclease family protein, partial [Bacteroidales bacterium]